MVSVEHEPKTDERSQRHKKPAQAAGKLGCRLNRGPKCIAKTEIGRCPDQAPQNSRGKEEAQPIAACASQQVHSRAQKREKGAAKEHAQYAPSMEEQLDSIPARRGEPEPAPSPFEELPTEHPSETIASQIAEHRGSHRDSGGR